MNFGRRLLFFMIGVSIGCFLVWGMLLRNRDMPNWTPSDRVKEEVTWNNILIADSIQMPWDSTQLAEAIWSSDIHFDKSVVRDKPCRTYEMTTEDMHDLSIQICDSVVTVVGFE